MRMNWMWLVCCCWRDERPAYMIGWVKACLYGRVGESPAYVVGGRCWRGERLLTWCVCAYIGSHLLRNQSVRREQQRWQKRLPCIQ